MEALWIRVGRESFEKSQFVEEAYVNKSGGIKNEEERLQMTSPIQ